MSETEDEQLIPEVSVREGVVKLLAESAVLRAAGLPEASVFQAETLDSPTKFPFFVIRWLDHIPGIGETDQRPFDLWSYDTPGDYSRAEKLGRVALQVLEEASPIKTKDGGCISQFAVRGENLGQGSDMYDDAWEALVIPFRAKAIARGI